MTWPPQPKPTDPDARNRRIIQRKLAEAGGKKARPTGQAIKRPEQGLQITVADWLRVATIPPARWWFVPNGGHLSTVQRGKFQRMGLTPGVYDLHFTWFVPYPTNRNFLGHYGPRFGVIEMKAPGNIKDTRESQDTFGADMDALGHGNTVCDSLEGVQAILTAWGFPLRRVQL